MTYSGAVKWLFDQVPNYQKDGPDKDYKIGLDAPRALWWHLGQPAKDIPKIHIAGTNGKGSTTAFTVSALMELGYRVGAFTSPHLFSFRERARIGAEEVPKEFVAQFVASHKGYLEEEGYSFFEITLMIALSWFAYEGVDYIVLETGLGGRLDATNICSPKLTLISNIGLDHTQFLGETRTAIAAEKAGIMKSGIKCIISEMDEETLPVFERVASQKNATLHFIDHSIQTKPSPLKGEHQSRNQRLAFTAVRMLTGATGFEEKAAENVLIRSGLKGRWQQIGFEPTVICDTGHNKEAFIQLVPMAVTQVGEGKLHWVLGMASDKDPKGVLELIPSDGSFYWANAKSTRVAKASHIKREAAALGLHGNCYRNVKSALAAAVSAAEPNDLIFVGGSTFVVADLKL